MMRDAKILQIYEDQIQRDIVGNREEYATV